MEKLSRKKLEEIAASLTKDFNEVVYGKVPCDPSLIRATDIDRLATAYLGLTVSYIRLSKDGSIYGLTTYADTQYYMDYIDHPCILPLKPNQILLDQRFCMPEKHSVLYGIRRFTLAHECAHQILYQMASVEEKSKLEKNYDSRCAYSLRELKTKEDWNEWQANVLGAAILMPAKEVARAFVQIAGGKRPVSYDGRFSYSDMISLRRFCHCFGVSKSAAVIRLRNLGYIEDRPYYEYMDPMEVFA